MNRDPRIVFPVQFLAGVLASSFLSLVPTMAVCQDEAKGSNGGLLQNVFNQGKSLFTVSPNKAREWEEKGIHAQAAQAHEKALGGALGLRKETPEEKSQGDKNQAEWKARRDARIAEQKAEQKAKDEFFDQSIKALDGFFKQADNTKANLAYNELLLQHKAMTVIEKRVEGHLDELGVEDDATRKEIIAEAKAKAPEILDLARPSIDGNREATPEERKAVASLFEDIDKRVTERVESKPLENAPPASKPQTTPSAPQPPSAPARTPEDEEADRRVQEMVTLAQEALANIKKREAFVEAVASETDKDPPKDPPKAKDPLKPPETPPGQQREVTDSEFNELMRDLVNSLENKPSQGLRPLEGLTQEELAELRRRARANSSAQSTALGKPTDLGAPSQATNEEYRRRAQGLLAAKDEKDRLAQRYLDLASELDGGLRQKEAWEAYQRSLANYNRLKAAWEAANPVCPKCGNRHPPDWHPL